MDGEPGGPPPDRSPRRPERDVMVLTELEQVKILADPLRIRILEELGQERTTKQVAKRLGEKATKLYHHVDALERVGLIELTRTRPNRGTLEKYYLARARTYRADPRIFAAREDPTEVESSPLTTIVTTIIDSTKSELARLTAGPQGRADLQEAGLVSFLEVRASPARQQELRSRLDAIITWLSTLDDEGDPQDERYRFTLAYFPLDPSPADDHETE